MRADMIYSRQGVVFAFCWEATARRFAGFLSRWGAHEEDHQPTKPV